MNRLSAMLGLLAVALLAPARAELPQYVMRDLGNYGRATIGPASINDMNQAAVTVWRGAVPSFLFFGSLGAPPEVFDGKRATAINAAGQVAGFVQGDATVQAFTWDGEFHDIPLSYAFAINDAGDVVGRLDDPFGGYLYSGGVLTRLPENFEPRAINNTGQVAGTKEEYPMYHPGIWEMGTLTWTGAFHGGVYAMNNLGWVVGWSQYAGYIWTGTELLIIGGTPLGINDSGRVVGQFGATIGAGVWQDGVLEKLPDYGVSSRAFAINNRGVVIGWAADCNDDFHLVAWEPVPEPGSLLALGTCLAATAFARRHTEPRG